MPENLLKLIEIWFSVGLTCIKWKSVYSKFYALPCGIRQGGVLSPYLFAIYVDSIVNRVKACDSGCRVKFMSINILMYADDILLLAPSVTALQRLFSLCESELEWLDMPINAKKTVCMRIGPKHQDNPCTIVTKAGVEINWAHEIRYLGVYLKSHKKFCCSVDSAKRAFYRSFNAIFGKIGRIANEDVILHLVKAKCLPMLLYGLEVCNPTKTQMKSLQNVINNCFMKIFNTRSKDVVDECMLMFDFSSVEQLIDTRLKKFLSNFEKASKLNLVCCAIVKIQ